MYLANKHSVTLVVLTSIMYFSNCTKLYISKSTPQKKQILRGTYAKIFNFFDTPDLDNHFFSAARRPPRPHPPASKEENNTDKNVNTNKIGKNCHVARDDYANENSWSKETTERFTIAVIMMLLMIGMMMATTGIRS